MNYAEAKELLNTTRRQKTGRPVANNTRLELRWIDDLECYAIKLHATDVVTIFPDDTYRLNTGSWYTVTTKARINEFSPARVYQTNGVWYVGDSVFYEGMIVGSTGKPTSPKSGTEMETAKKKIDKEVKRYISGWVKKALEDGKLEEPGGGDCWLCLFKPPAGSYEGGLDHLLSHFEDDYYVPSLLWKAIIEAGYAEPGFIWQMTNADLEKGRDPNLMRRALGRYFRTRKLKLAELIAVSER